MAVERLQKILARAGYGSRRSTEELIAAGRVTVNGVSAILGTRADAEADRIEVDDHPVKTNAAMVYIALNKPRGVLSDFQADDPRKSVFDLVPVREHLFAVGRLDFDSEGLVLLTNDGELANRLTHPRYEHEKEYRVQVVKKPDEIQLTTWRRGVVLEDGYKTAPARVDIESVHGSTVWLRVVLKEGRKRQIREVGNRIGLPVERIIRVRIGSLLLGNLKPKDWRALSHGEVTALKGLQGKEKSGSDKARTRIGKSGPFSRPRRATGKTKQNKPPR
jgi:23S rRNA pseudouridine2605 synthase